MSLLLDPLESSGTNIPIRLCNPTDKPITLYRTLKVGMMEEVESQVGAVSTQSDCTTRQSCSSASPGKNSHLQHLVNSASKHSQKEALTLLLVKYSDIFPTPQEPLGLTSKLHHSINTGSAHPIRQHVRQVPPAQQEVVKRPLDDMLLMSLVLSGLQWSSCLVYLDDIIFMGKTFEEHLKNLDLVFSRIRDAGLKIKPESYPHFKLPFLLDTDASNDAIGAILSQLDEQGNERVLAYASRLLSKAERNYCVSRKELLSVVSFTAHFRPYLLGHRFTLRTDCAPLTWLYGVKEPEGQVARWLEQLQELDFKIIHRPGNVGHTGEDDKNDESATIATLQLSSYVSAKINDKQMEDQELQLIITAKQSNERIALAQEAAGTLELRRLLQIWDQLTVSNGVLYWLFLDTAQPSDGDMVWLFNPAIRKGQPRKLHKPWSGPYRIRRKMSEVTYQIQHTGNHKLKVVHFNRLKRCPNNIRLPARKSPPVPSSEPAESPPVGSSLELLEEEEPQIPLPPPTNPHYPPRERRPPDRLAY
eukprot:Em0020g788a